MEEKEKLETGNIPEDVVSRQEQVAGRTVDVVYNKDDTEFSTPLGAKTPDGLEGEELTNWQEQAGNEFKMKSSANDKYAEAAKLRSEIETEKAELAKQKEEFNKLKSEYKQPVKATSDKPDFYKILSENSDTVIRDIDDEIDFKEDNPKAYLKAQRKYEQEKDKFILSRTSNPSDKIETILMRERIERDGAEYSSVESFAKLRGWKVDAYSYDAYKNANPKRESTTNKINKFTQPTDFVWLDPGKKVEPIGKKLVDEFETREELDKYLDSEMEKEHPDPRVLEFLK